MALVDFHQLAILFKLACEDVPVLSNTPNPPQMVVETRSQSRLKSYTKSCSTVIGLGDRSYLARPLPLEPRTPTRRYFAPFQGSVLSTPTARGVAAANKLELDPDQPQKGNSAKYEEFLAQDFKRHRVFVDIDVFMERVLHVPHKWRSDWKTTIKKIKNGPPFAAALKEYKSLCKNGAVEVMFYKPLVEMANAIFNGAKSSERGNARPRTPVRYLRNDPNRMTGGVITGLSPDIVAVHENFLSDMDQEVVKDGCLYGTRLTWAQPVQLLEVKPWNGALVDGSCMPRLLVNGRDPKVDHAKPRKWAKKPPTADNEGSSAACSSLEPMNETPLTDNSGKSATCNPLKRAADEPSESSRKALKLHGQSTPGGGTSPGGESEPRVTRTGETQEQRKAHLQVGRYLLEQFSVPAFRSHATIGLVDNHRVQFIHANHSVILVSSAIDFLADGEGGLDKFIAILIAFNRFTLADNGILNGIGGGPFRENGLLLESNEVEDPALMQENKTLKFKKKGKEKEFIVKYGKVISHEPSLAGRGTAVLHAECERWKDEKLVIKISWPGVGRDAEDLFIKRATDIAKNNETHKWALNHLPKVFYAQDIVFDQKSTHGKVAELFKDAKFAGDVGYEYEQRTQRIIIQERLYPLKNLSNVKDIAQVLLDVACIHRWLYEVAGILHRDLSMKNIMYRIVKGKVHGVLMDYDLSSWTKKLTSDYAKTSQQRTGTPPFMAYELLDPNIDMLHLYRHDLESLFYIMLILATQYEVQAPGESGEGCVGMREELPYRRWFNQQSYGDLSSFKHTFLTELEPLDLSPTFVEFRSWLVCLRAAFRVGLRSRVIHREKNNPEARMLQDHQDEVSEDGVAPFDDETLGGHVCYSAIIDPVANFKGTLKDLEVRYKGATTSATQTTA